MSTSPLASSTPSLSLSQASRWMLPEDFQTSADSSKARTPLEDEAAERSRLLGSRRLKRSFPADDPTEKTGVPSEAYGSPCPLEACCGVPARKLPVCQHRLLQRCFGNVADVAQKTQDENLDEEALREGELHLDTQVMLGIGRHQESGWRVVPKVRPSIGAEQALLMHKRKIAMEILGLQAVEREVDGMKQKGLQLTFPKNKIPGTVAAVKQLLKKLNRLHPPGAVNLISACEDDDNVYFVYEDVPYLGRFPMHVAEHGGLSHTDGAVLLQQLAATVEAMARHRLHLLDWSAWNVFSTSFAGVVPVKLFGIGLAGVMYAKALPDGAAFADPDKEAFRFQSPEVYRALYQMREKEAVGLTRSASHFTQVDEVQRLAADTWSLAAIAYFAFSGRAPVLGSCPSSTREEIMNGIKFRDVATEFPGISAEGLTFLQAGLQAQPQNRSKVGEFISTPWITTQVTKGGNLNINDVIDCLRDFCKSPEVTRAIITIARPALNPAKREALLELFRSLDIRGDGDIDLDELIALAVHRKKHIKEVYRILYEGSNEDEGLGFSDFLCANLMSAQMLSERMLLEVFNCIRDNRARDKVDLGLVYETFASVNEDVRPEHVEDFFCQNNVERDWKMLYTFEDFVRCFPLCRSSTAEANQRVQQCKDFCRAMHHATGKFLARVDEWLDEVVQCLDALKEVRQKNLKVDYGGTQALVFRGLRIMRRMVKLMNAGRVPRAQYTENDYKMMQVSKSEIAEGRDDKTKMEIAVNDLAEDTITRVTNAAKKATRDRKELDRQRHAVHAVDSFVRAKQREWEVTCRLCVLQGTQVLEEKSVEDRQRSMAMVLRRMIEPMDALVRDVKAAAAEQASILEAANAIEEGMMERPWSRAGLSSGRPGLETPKAILAEFLEDKKEAEALEDAMAQEAKAGETPKRRTTMKMCLRSLGPHVVSKAKDCSLSMGRVLKRRPADS